MRLFPPSRALFRPRRFRLHRRLPRLYAHLLHGEHEVLVLVQPQRRDPLLQSLGGVVTQLARPGKGQG